MRSYLDKLYHQKLYPKSLFLENHSYLSLNFSSYVVDPKKLKLEYILKFTKEIEDISWILEAVRQ